MKKLVLLFAITLISFTSFANETKPVNVKSELRSEIVKLLGKANFDLNGTLTTVVEFTVNSKGEIIVLTVNSKNTALDKYVKNKLNYNVITNKAIVKGKVYKMPLKIVKA